MVKIGCWKWAWHSLTNINTIHSSVGGLYFNRVSYKRQRILTSMSMIIFSQSPSGFLLIWIPTYHGFCNGLQRSECNSFISEKSWCLWVDWLATCHQMSQEVSEDNKVALGVEKTWPRCTTATSVISIEGPATQHLKNKEQLWSKLGVWVEIPKTCDTPGPFKICLGCVTLIALHIHHQLNIAAWVGTPRWGSREKT